MDKREKLLKIISELMGVLNTKNISPDEAKRVVSNEKAVKKYMETSVFHGSSPKK